MIRILFYALTAMQLLVALGAASAYAKSLTLIHPGAPGSLYEISANEFASRLSGKLPSPYDVSVTTNPGLGDGIALLDSVKNGRATFALAGSGLVSLSNSFAIFELPFLFRSRDQIRAIREGLLTPYLEPEAQRHGLHILGVWENGFRHITNDQWPIDGPEDFQGLKIAVPPANVWRENFVRALGAVPIAMSPRSFATALEESDVNGQEAPLLQIASLNLPEMQYHLALSDHLYSPSFLVTSAAELDGLPREIRKIIAEEAEAMESWVQEIAIRIESELVDRLDQSMQMSHINRDAFVKATRPLYKDFVTGVPDGAKMIQLVQSYEVPLDSAENLGVFLQTDQGSSDK